MAWQCVRLRGAGGVLWRDGRPLPSRTTSHCSIGVTAGFRRTSGGLSSAAAFRVTGSAPLPGVQVKDRRCRLPEEGQGRRHGLQTLTFRFPSHAEHLECNSNHKSLLPEIIITKQIGEQAGLIRKKKINMVSARGNKSYQSEIIF